MTINYKDQSWSFCKFYLTWHKFGSNHVDRAYFTECCDQTFHTTLELFLFRIDIYVCMAHAVVFVMIRTATTWEHLWKILTQCKCDYKVTAVSLHNKELSFKCHRRLPGQRFVRVLKRPHTLGLKFRWEGRRQHDQTLTKIASLLECFPATLVVPVTWPDWSKFQFLRFWYNHIKLRPTRHKVSTLTTTTRLTGIRTNFFITIVPNQNLLHSGYEICTLMILT